MKKIKYLISLFFSTFLIGQSPINSIGHGIIIDSPDPSSLGLSSSGLIPSGNNFFSLNNPSTWTELNFTYLSVNYKFNNINSENYNFYNSSLSGISFIVPINNTYAFGLGVKPFSRKDYEIFSKQENINFNDEFYSLNRRYKGSGGISSFFNSLSFKISKKHILASQIDFMFGSYNESTSSFVSSKEYIYNQVFGYKATMFSIYYKFIDSFNKRDFNFFSAINFPIGKKHITQTNNYQFSDESNFADKPFILPNKIRLGFLYNLYSSIFVSSEFSNTSFSSLNSTYSNLYDHQFKSSNRLSLSFQRMKTSNSRDLFERLQYRFGFFTMGHYIRLPDSDINESGVSFGISLPFGISQNQIDLGIRFSKRNGFLNNSDEILSQFSIGMVIGDLWLVKGKRR